MQSNDFARKFTDIEYLSKKEVSARLGGATSEAVWTLVNNYREKFRFALDMKRYDRLPFSIVLTPSIMALSNTAERLLFQYAMLFENHRIFQNFSIDKNLDLYKHNILVEDLLVLAHSAEMEISERNIEAMLDSDTDQLKDSHIYGFYEGLQWISSNSDLKIDFDLFKGLWSRLNHTPLDRVSTIYRMNELLLDSKNTYLGSDNYLGAPVNRIPEYMNMLWDFYHADYELSPFIISSILFSFLLYTLPFERYSEHFATLLYEKILADSGYGECAYYLSLPQFLVQRRSEWDTVLDEIRRTGDLTYGIVFLNQVMADAIQWRIKSLYKVGLPKPSHNEVRVVEKIVEKIVEVPVEKEVIKEVIREVIKEVPVPYEVPVYQDKSVSESQKVLPQAKESIASFSNTTYNFIDDPFANMVARPTLVQDTPVIQTLLKDYRPIQEENKTVIESKMMEEPTTLVPPPEVKLVVEEASIDKPEVNVTPVTDNGEKPSIDVEPVIEEISGNEPMMEQEPHVIEEMVEEPIPSEESLYNEKLEVETKASFPERPVVEPTPSPGIPSPKKIQEENLPAVFDLTRLAELSDEEVVKHLMEVNPLVREHQALFYASHRTGGRYYTIGQFKQFSDCAYETARTSMDFLTSLGLYQKEQLKNKFVYTPKKEV